MSPSFFKKDYIVWDFTNILETKSTQIQKNNQWIKLLTLEKFVPTELRAVGRSVQSYSLCSAVVLLAQCALVVECCDVHGKHRGSNTRFFIHHSSLLNQINDRGLRKFHRYAYRIPVCMFVIVRTYQRAIQLLTMCGCNGIHCSINVSITMTIDQRRYVSRYNERPFIMMYFLLVYKFCLLYLFVVRSKNLIENKGYVTLGRKQG